MSRVARATDFCVRVLHGAENSAYRIYMHIEDGRKIRKGAVMRQPAKENKGGTKTCRCGGMTRAAAPAYGESSKQMVLRLCRLHGEMREKKSETC